LPSDVGCKSLALVRSVMVAALRDHYRVVAAADGLEALEVFRAAEGWILVSGFAGGIEIPTEELRR
jgi:hypothetical protein